MSLPDGFDTQIGDGGTALSGGQAQRIVIARAIIRKPELLILDEATSALDGESARGIYTLVQRLKKSGIGCLVVTHDSNMMRSCEDCVFLSDGKVLERGSYADLVNRHDGRMRKLIGM